MLMCVSVGVMMCVSVGDVHYSPTHFCKHMCILHTTSLPYTVYMKYLSHTHITHTHTLTHRDEDPAAWNKGNAHAHDANEVRPAGAHLQLSSSACNSLLPPATLFFHLQLSSTCNSLLPPATLSHPQLSTSSAYASVCRPHTLVAGVHVP